MFPEHPDMIGDEHVHGICLFDGLGSELAFMHFDKIQERYVREDRARVRGAEFLEHDDVLDTFPEALNYSSR